MNYTVGIDLGSTTTKAVVLGEDGAVLGRGITNSRSNYDVACQVALSEALINTRFSLIAGEFRGIARDPGQAPILIGALERKFRAEQYRSQLRVLDTELHRFLSRLLTRPPAAGAIVDRILDRMQGEIDALYAEGARRKSDFFRDLAGSRYLALAEDEARTTGVSFDLLAGLFDKAILDVENSAEAAGRFDQHAA
ncbi:MAG TPA: BadF/BadG/BcrA/BcrD ATPase family protein, partial [Thermoanaerobaculia bacterium]|nr:BadF/BadG/BcrA/BcrD ATPase family protein [Thermoanaerobaculia bacterium]